MAWLRLLRAVAYLELASALVRPEPQWHKGCSWCWRTIWHARA